MSPTTDSTVDFDTLFTNRPVILGMGVLAGLVLAIGLAVVLEGMSSAFYHVRDVQSVLGMPVLASIPAIVLEADEAARRRMWMRRAIAAVVLTALLLGTGIVSYVAVNGLPGFMRALTEGAPENADEQVRARSVERATVS